MKENQEIILVDNYYLYKQIGKGYSSEVYQAYDFKKDIQVAVKVITKNENKLQQEKYIETEKLILYTCKNYNLSVIQILDFFESQKNYYFVLELCNYSLKDYLANKIEQNEVMSEKQALNILRQIILGISCLFKDFICHSDLKPGNILIKVEENKSILKIADFGLSTFIDLEETQKFKGTQHYMAPEVRKLCNGNQSQRYDPKQADLYSLGVIYYEMLFQKVPPNPLDQAFVSGRNDISQQSIDLIKSLLNEDPKARYQWEDLENDSLIQQDQPFESQQLYSQQLQSDNQQYLTIKVEIITNLFNQVKSYLEQFEQFRKDNSLIEIDQKILYNILHLISRRLNRKLSNLINYCEKRKDNLAPYQKDHLQKLLEQQKNQLDQFYEIGNKLGQLEGNLFKSVLFQENCEYYEFQQKLQDYDKLFTDFLAILVNLSPKSNLNQLITDGYNLQELIKIGMNFDTNNLESTIKIKENKPISQIKHFFLSSHILRQDYQSQINNNKQSEVLIQEKNI